jgi:hypothetical protein
VRLALEAGMLHVPLHAWAKDGSRVWTFNPDLRQWFEIRLEFPHWMPRRGTTRARDAVEHDGVGIPVWPGEGGR